MISTGTPVSTPPPRTGGAVWFPLGLAACYGHYAANARLEAGIVRDVAITVGILAHAAGLFTGLQVILAASAATCVCAAAIIAVNIGWGIRWLRRWWQR